LIVDVGNVKLDIRLAVLDLLWRRLIQIANLYLLPSQIACPIHSLCIDATNHAPPPTMTLNEILSALHPRHRDDERRRITFHPLQGHCGGKDKELLSANQYQESYARTQLAEGSKYETQIFQDEIKLLNVLGCFSCSLDLGFARAAAGTSFQLARPKDGAVDAECDVSANRVGDLHR
jgi:hypothetical protein